MATQVLFPARPDAILIEWFRESRWRAHVINAARCAMETRRGAVQGQTPRPSIGVQREAAREARGAAGPMIPQAGCIAATFIAP